MPKSRTYSCQNCPIEGKTHIILSKDKLAHFLAISRHQSRPASSGDDSQLADMVAQMHLSGSHSVTASNDAGSVARPLDVSDLEQSGHVQSQTSVSSADQLADLVIGLSLTETSPAIPQQSSKLFSTRDEFQDLHASEIPGSFSSIPISEANASIQTVMRSSTYPGFKSIERNTTTLEEIRERMAVARATVDSVELLYGDNQDSNSLRLTYDVAGEVVVTCGNLLKSVDTRKSQELAQLKDEVLSELRVLDKRIDLLGSWLPKDSSVKTPLEYKAGKIIPKLIIVSDSRLD